MTLNLVKLPEAYADVILAWVLIAIFAVHAYLAFGRVYGGAASLTVNANGTNHTNAVTKMVTGGALAFSGAGSVAEVQEGADVEASVGSTASLTFVRLAPRARNPVANVSMLSSSRPRMERCRAATWPG